MFKSKIKDKKPIATSLANPSSIFIKTDKYALRPIKAKELFSRSESQRPIPEMVPNKGPKARSI